MEEVPACDLHHLVSLMVKGRHPSPSENIFPHHLEVRQADGATLLPSLLSLHPWAPPQPQHLLQHLGRRRRGLSALGLRQRAGYRLNAMHFTFSPTATQARRCFTSISSWSSLSMFAALLRISTMIRSTACDSCAGTSLPTTPATLNSRQRTWSPSTVLDSWASTNCLNTSSVITRPVGVTNTCGLVTWYSRCEENTSTSTGTLLPSRTCALRARRIVSTDPEARRSDRLGPK
eukprot:745720-Hanusia_phi.AAC.6